MNETAITRRCPLCREPVQDDARKCPHCLHYLNRWTLLAYHPLVGGIPFFLMMFGAIYLLSRVFDRGESFELYQSQVRVEESRIEFGENSAGGTVVAVGKIQNDSAVAWKDPELEVQFLDGSKRVFDTTAKYSTIIPAHGACAFKLSQRREFPKEDYQSCVVRVLWARDGRGWP